MKNQSLAYLNKQALSVHAGVLGCRDRTVRAPPQPIAELTLQPSCGDWHPDQGGIGADWHIKRNCDFFGSMSNWAALVRHLRG